MLKHIIELCMQKYIKYIHLLVVSIKEIVYFKYICNPRRYTIFDD